MELNEEDSVYGEELAQVPDEAAITIQSAWRRHSFVKLIRAYNNLKLDLASVRKMDFEQLASTISNPSTIKIVNDLLDRARKSSNSSVTRKITNGARIFLTSLVIVCHSDAILMEMNDKEQHLQKVANEMLNSFERWIHSYQLPKGVNHALANFLSTWTLYYMSFAEWKTKDKIKYTEKLIEHYLDLERLWNSVKHQVDADHEWKPKIDEERVRLRSELEKIGGSTGLAKLAERLNNFESEEAVSESAAMDVDRTKVNEESIANAGPSMPIHVPPPQEKIPTVAVSKSRRQSATGFQTGASSSSAAPASRSLVDSLGAIAPGTGLTNELLAHELILDPNFELQNYVNENSGMAGIGGNNQLKQIRETAKKAFFDAVREEFSQQKYDHWLPLLLNDVKTQLLAMLNEKGSTAQSINESMDMELIEQQIRHNVFDIESCLRFVISIMKRMCAPVRDSEIQAIEKMNHSDLSLIFERILAILDNMRMDLVNFRLAQLRPMLKENIVTYEMEKFESHLAKGDFTIEGTKAWLNKAIEEALQRADDRNPENIENTENRPKYQEIFADALINLLISNVTPGTATVFPETMRLDQARILSFQNEIQALTIVSALNMLLRNSFPNYRRELQAQSKLRENILLLLMDSDTKLDNIQVMVVETIRQCRQTRAAMLNDPSVAEVKKEEVDMINSVVDKTLSTKDKVFSLLQRRLAAVIKTHLVYGKFKPEIFARHGLDIVGKELAVLSEKIFRFSQHNREVYAKWYDDILKQGMN